MEIRDNEDSAIKLLQENVELKKIIKEVREELRKYEYDNEANRYAPVRECLEILNKVK